MNKKDKLFVEMTIAKMKYQIERIDFDLVELECKINPTIVISSDFTG